MVRRLQGRKTQQEANGITAAVYAKPLTAGLVTGQSTI